MRAHITDIIMDDNTECQLYQSIPPSYLHSHSQLTKLKYTFTGEIQLKGTTRNDIFCTIDAYAYRARKVSTGEVKRLKNGTYRDHLTGQQRSLKLIGVLREGRLFVLVGPAGERVSDIAPLAPLRVSGMSQMYQIRRRGFSSSENQRQSA